MDKPVLIFGAKSFGKASLDIFLSNGNIVYGFLEEDKSFHGKEINDIPVLGDISDEQFLDLLGDKCDAFVGISEIDTRLEIIEKLIGNLKVMPINAIHKHTSIARTAVLSHGGFFNSGVIVGANAFVGNHCVLNTSSVLDFESRLGHYVELGAGCVVNSSVEIEDNVFIGSGAVVVSGVKIGQGARIGAGSLVISDVGKNQTVFGNPAKVVE